MESGELIVYRLGTGVQESVAYREASDKELVILEHIPPQRQHRFCPDLMLAPGNGPLTAFATSDIGRSILLRRVHCLNHISSRVPGGCLW
jgi:hypothetical protein